MLVTTSKRSSSSSRSPRSASASSIRMIELLTNRMACVRQHGSLSLEALGRDAFFEALTRFVVGLDESRARFPAHQPVHFRAAAHLLDVPRQDVLAAPQPGEAF